MLASSEKGDNFMNDKKTARVKITMTAAEKEMIKRKAAAARLTVSDFARALVEDRKIYVADDLPEAARQLIKVGCNASQISFVARTCGNVPTEKVQELDDNIKAIHDEFAHLLRVIQNSKERKKPRFYSRPKQ